MIDLTTAKMLIESLMGFGGFVAVLTVVCMMLGILRRVRSEV